MLYKFAYVSKYSDFFLLVILNERVLMNYY